MERFLDHLLDHKSREQTSLRNRDGARQARTRRKPVFVGLEFDADLVVMDTQVTVAITRYRLRRDLLHLLRDDADVGAIAAIVAEAIVAKTVGKMAKQRDVVLDCDVGSPSAAPTAATTEATAAAAAESATAAGSYAATSAETSTADARATASRRNVRSSRPHVS